MKVLVKKWGNSAAVRIPAPVMAAMSLQLDQIVDVREEEGRIIIEPVPQSAVTLDSLLDQITADNIPDDVDFGRPVGGEFW
ncbi:AbrB/MazE/SpoVT family DNA-binding domain-containing protein [Acidisoma cellulosilytica]|uniref:AbrB/MazE/SpoVT family DNA-binding domain-containing protein n=1 Tax=Acidisoma cellulosilyticum TaxID=2802395 RepID=A0A964E4U5_9PROT|nr:AbrB/MazE/SpoVT family DNA-binding domain-containing protein [Acidisoma cellulosilyticum]MCB8881819.1 AbrB/MazE/SpoVT family DNA-binding domain-containing protein [Acidisoma cellulosilyticum]